MEIIFILVEPALPENIGASARAIKTMGFRSLRMVNPVHYLTGKASWVAHGSDDILDNAAVYKTLAEAVEDATLVIGTTARYRTIKKEYIPADRLVSLIGAGKHGNGKIAIVFGREESGLTNEELKLCDITTTVPLASGFPSLNLAQAVMIYAWELSQMVKHGSDTSGSTDVTETSSAGSVRALKEKAAVIMKNTGIDRQEALCGRIMERISLAGETDIRLMHSVTSAIIEKFNTKNPDK
ncbi:MAG: tRNA/rRNA methyltransferase [Bacteroidales bacterium]